MKGVRIRRLLTTMRAWSTNKWQAGMRIIQQRLQHLNRPHAPHGVQCIGGRALSVLASRRGDAGDADGGSHPAHALCKQNDCFQACLCCTVLDRTCECCMSALMRSCQQG